MIYVGAYIPKIILPLLHRFVVSKSSEFAPPYGIGDHVYACPEGNLPDLIFLCGFEKLLAGHFDRVWRSAPAKPLEKV